jgi:hypothetical protein
VLVISLVVHMTEAGVGYFYLQQCRGQRLVLVLTLTVQRTEAGVGSISYSAEDRAWCWFYLYQRTEAGVSSFINSAEDRGWCWFYL